MNGNLLEVIMIKIAIKNAHHKKNLFKKILNKDTLVINITQPMELIENLFLANQMPTECMLILTIVKML